MLEAVSQAVDNLLDRKHRDQNAAYWNRRVERGNWRQRRHAEAGKATQEIEITKNDEANCYAQYDQPGEDLDCSSEFSSQAFGNRCQIEMIIAAGGHGSPKENRINKECRCHLLQPKPGVADRACNYVENDRAAKSE